ncbi:MAG: serine protease [Verrucomicrobia bacterium]|nr:MAG: serine protease [Verrucomicrobiota bacterium]
MIAAPHRRPPRRWVASLPTSFAGRRRCFLATLLTAAMMPALAGPALGAKPDQTAPASPTRLFVVDDAAILRRMVREGRRLAEAKETVRLEDLKHQLESRRTARVKLAFESAGAPARPVEQWLPSRRQGTVAVVNAYLCDRCGRWHAAAASGFFVSPDGLVATCRHVVEGAEQGVLFVFTAAGRALPIEEVVAADADVDLALLKVPGDGHPALRLAEPPPTGAPVFVLSHPDDHFYVLTEGRVARHYRAMQRGFRPHMMAITADFALGSSGGPVFDAAGRVVALAASTDSVYYHETRRVQRDLQMVFKQCIPAVSLRRLAEQQQAGP